MLHLIEKHAPGVTLLRPGLAILRARGISRYHGGEAEAADALAAVLAEAGFPEVRIGVADGPFTAEIAARGSSPCTVVPREGHGTSWRRTPCRCCATSRSSASSSGSVCAPSATSPRSPRSTFATASASTVRVCTHWPPAPTPVR
ncbi:MULTISPECIES: hypothetical protein [unclassified Microbacterium]|uniref:hypothetical protein n=1 Tax=unclassified Microbacterium TaxID=2609290 RepID=UPI001FCEFCA9|nr:MULTISPECIES: hypothetical protein [unclassified Microbacterium]